VTMQGITIPLYIEHNRPYIDLDILGSEDSPHEAQFLVDTGGGSFLLPEAVAHKVGMLLTGKDLIRESGSYLVRISPPRVSAGGMRLDLAQTVAFVALENGTVKHGYGILPGHILARYRVTFDYQHRQFMLAAPEPFVPRGKAFNTPVHQKSNFPRIEVEIDRQKYGMLLDTGASFTMISSTLLEQLATRHPDWPRASGGAIETANMGERTVSDRNDPHVLQSVQVGDIFLQVDALKVTGLSLPQVVDALRGEPGHLHMLLLERDGALLAANVPTARIL